jgi:hypothetical protein
MGLAEITLLLDSTNKNDKNYRTLYTVYLLKLSELVLPKMATNQLITGFCNLPESEVRIDVQGNKPVNKRQYRIAFALHSVVDDQIAEWKESTIVKESAVHSPWNNPLLVVPKLDSNGLRKGWRVCIDPRPLNLLIPEINYPLPLIRNIFEAFKGK